MGSRGRPPASRDSGDGASDAYALTAISSSAMPEAPKSAAASISDFLKGKLSAARQTPITEPSPPASISDASAAADNIPAAKLAAASVSYNSSGKPTEQIAPKIPAWKQRLLAAKKGDTRKMETD